MPLRTLTIRGLPDATLNRLRERASANRRSLNGELLSVLDAVAAEPAETSSSALVVRESPAVPFPSQEAGGLPLVESVDQAALAAVCQRHHIQWLAVFGSFARGDIHPDSDVDVVVDFASGKTPGFGLVRIAEGLRPLFQGRRVDLLTRRGLSPRLRGPILNSAITLYAEK